MNGIGTKTVAIIGGGPAGLMAAETLAARGFTVDLYEHKPSLARKFLMAGRGGLNITHSEAMPDFLKRYGAAAPFLTAPITAFSPGDLRAWCEGLGQKTFVGSSGRVFPEAMKASPLLRAWQTRLESLGVRIHLNHRWLGFADDGALRLENADGIFTARADATLLALGGASWPRLGSDGAWTDILAARGVSIAPLLPANSGFEVAWSDIFKSRFSGQPVKPVTLHYEDITHKGEIMITARGVEGGAIYALSSRLRDGIQRDGNARMTLDLRPDISHEKLTEKLSAPRGRLSFSNVLRRTRGLSPVAAALLREAHDNPSALPADALARLVKGLPLTLTAPFGLERAISSAGGIRLDAIDDNYMLRALPGVFAAGEMLDWEAPTGGYLLQATFATAIAAANGISRYLSTSR